MVDEGHSNNNENIPRHYGYFVVLKINTVRAL